MLNFLIVGLAILHPASEHAHAPVVVPPEARTAVAVPFHPVDLLHSGQDNAEGLAFYEFRVPPRSAGAPPHVHAHEDEFFYVVTGTAQFLNGETVIEAGPGHFAALTRNHTHAFWNAGDEELVLLAGVTAGGFEAFFDAVAAEIAQGAPDDPAQMGALIARHAAERGIEIQMDRMPDAAAPFYGPPG